MPPRRMFPFAPGALHQAIRANDTMPAPTCANQRADGEMRLCAEATAWPASRSRTRRTMICVCAWRRSPESGDGDDVPHSRIRVVCEGDDVRRGRIHVVCEGDGQRSVATTRAAALWRQEDLDRRLARQLKKSSCDNLAARYGDSPGHHSSGRPWRPRVYRLFGTFPRTTG